MSQLNQATVGNNLAFANLLDWNRPLRVLDLSRGCQFMADVESLNVGIGAMGSKSLDTRDYRDSYVGDTERVAQIQNVATIGNTLVIDFQPINGNPVEFYRLRDIVYSDREQVQGQVTSATSGQIVIEPFADTPNVAALAATFLIGSNVFTIGNRVPDQYSAPGVGLNYVPELQINYLSTMRDDATWTRMDFRKTRFEWMNGYWINGQIDACVERLLLDIERSWIWGRPQAPNSQDISSNGGIDWSIRERGGEVFEWGALPTENAFIDWLSAIIKRRPYSVKRKKLYMGNKLFQYINQNFAPNFLQQLAIDPSAPRTGEINRNMNVWKVGGFEFDLQTNVGFLLDGGYRNQLTSIPGLTGMRKEWSCWVIEQEPVRLKDGGTVPAIEKLHFGESPFYITGLSGIGDCPVGMPGSDDIASSLKLGTSTSAIDMSSMHLMYHGGVNMATGEGSGYCGPAI